jgi:hypothetical protein
VLKYELQGRKFSTETEVKQSTAAALSNISGNGLLHMSEKLVGHHKNGIACERRYIEKEIVPKPQESSDSE